MAIFELLGILVGNGRGLRLWAGRACQAEGDDEGDMAILELITRFERGTWFIAFEQGA